MQKNIPLLTLFILAALIGFSCKNQTVIDFKRQTLSTGWKVHPTDSIVNNGQIISTAQQPVEGWYSSDIPSTLMGVLIENGMYPNLFTGKNIQEIDKSLFDKSWWFRKEFTVPKLIDNQNVTLTFEGLSYYANIWLNGKLIASRDSVYGPYRQFSFNVTPYIKENNILAVETFRAQPGDPNIGFADWNPRPADESMGIFRDVKLTVTGVAKLNNISVQSRVNTSTLDEAWLTVETDVENLTNTKVTGELIGRIENITFSKPVILNPGEKKKVKITTEDTNSLHLKKPRLWWCNNMGEPELYKLDLSFRTNNTISDKDSVTFGIRQVETYLTEEGHRGFKLNGKNVLLKGAGWSDDIFLRETPESNETQVRYVKDMNMNTIRFESFWGKNQNIYDLCDRYGIMLILGWSCQWEWDAYYGEPCNLEHGCILSEEDMDVVAKSFADQVLWLRNHPSILFWMPGSDMLQKPELEQGYLDFLKENDNRPYVGAAKSRMSPISGPTGTKMAGPYEYVGPNYWYTDTIYGGAFGFNTETGIGAQLPVIESIRKFIPEDKLWPINDSWGFHCTASTTAMNSLAELTKVMDAKYGKAKNLDDFLMKADLINYDATRAMFEAFRVNIGKTTGLIHWMLNSAWPSLYWQLYDYYKVPTSAYYSVKKANQPIQLIYNYGDNCIYIVNETNKHITGYKAGIKMYSINSKELLNEMKDVNISSALSGNIYQLAKLKENAFLSLTLFDADGNLVADNFYTLSTKPDTYNWDKTTWVTTPMTGYNDYKNLAKIDKTELDISVTQRTENSKITYRVELANNYDNVAFFVNLKLKDQNDEILQPVFWSDNYISILPNQKTVVECTANESLINKQKIHLEVKGWNCPLQKIDL